MRPRNGEGRVVVPIGGQEGRDNSYSQVISSRGLTVRPVEDDARALPGHGIRQRPSSGGTDALVIKQLCSLSPPHRPPIATEPPPASIYPACLEVPPLNTNHASSMTPRKQTRSIHGSSTNPCILPLHALRSSARGPGQ
jgi:hypothetical protein